MEFLMVKGKENLLFSKNKYNLITNSQGDSLSLQCPGWSQLSMNHVCSHVKPGMGTTRFLKKAIRSHHPCLALLITHAMGTNRSQAVYP